jgi:hypothetical protein
MSNNNNFIKNSILFSFVFLALSVTSQEIEEVVVTATKKRGVSSRCCHSN